jgi:hypothetical protein
MVNALRATLPLELKLRWLPPLVVSSLDMAGLIHQHFRGV